MEQGNSIEYRTKDGDRWDLIAWNFYGDASKFGPIIQANPDVVIDTVLDGGITLYIPILPDDEIQQSNDTLPPWKK